MKKTFKEKYFELLKEKTYLQYILDCKSSDYINLKNEFDGFKFDLMQKEERNEKHSFIIFLIFLGIMTSFSLLGLILTSLGLM